MGRDATIVMMVLIHCGTKVPSNIYALGSLCNLPPQRVKHILKSWNKPSIKSIDGWCPLEQLAPTLFKSVNPTL